MTNTVTKHTRHPKKPEPDGKLNGPTLTKMRDIAFGKSSKSQAFQILDKAEKMRDDDASLDEAEEKRKRKNAKRALFAHNGGTLL